MLTLIPDLPSSVVGVEAHERVSAEDYENVLVPAVEAARGSSEHARVRLLYVLGHDMPDFSAGTAWEDTKLGLGHLRSWERIAIVSDADWLRQSAHALDWVMPGEIKVFDTADLDAARAWLTS